MEIVNISKNKLNCLDDLELPINVFNTEADILKFNYGGKEKVFKKLKETNGIVFANKLYTLEALKHNKDYIPNNFVVPEFWISINKQIEGFAMKYVSGSNLSLILNDYNIDSDIDIDEKLYYLKKIGQILEQMKKIRNYTPLNDFYLGDLHEDNFIVNLVQKEVYVIDLDSIKIANNNSPIVKYLSPFALLFNVDGKYQTEFENSYFSRYKVDENTDLYCYIIVILNYLYNGKINNVGLEEFYSFLNYLDDIDVNLSLLEAFNRILSGDDNINPVNYIDSLSRMQIAKARNYSRMKKGFKF